MTCSHRWLPIKFEGVWAYWLCIDCQVTHPIAAPALSSMAPTPAPVDASPR